MHLPFVSKLAPFALVLLSASLSFAVAACSDGVRTDTDAGIGSTDDGAALVDAAWSATHDATAEDATFGNQSDAGDASATASGLDAAIDAGDDAGDPLQCPGATPASAPPNIKRCRSKDDCQREESCGPVYFAGGCGACNPGFRNCEDGTCPAGQVCLESETACACNASELSSDCSPRCEVTGCGGNERCEADGRCAPKPCSDDSHCASGYECNPARSSADAHGCAVLRCAETAAACPEGMRCDPSITADGLSGCVDIACNQGYACPVNKQCAPESGYPHGCAPKTCRTDDDCGCGPCIQEVCQEQLFVCSPPPVP